MKRRASDTFSAVGVPFIFNVFSFSAVWVDLCVMSRTRGLKRQLMHVIIKQMY